MGDIMGVARIFFRGGNTFQKKFQKILKKFFKNCVKILKKISTFKKNFLRKLRKIYYFRIFFKKFNKP